MIQAETIQPLIKSLSDPEKRKLADWLQAELTNIEPPKVHNEELRARLIRHITKSRK